MKLVIQRVKESSVTIDNKLYSKIGKGIMVLLGVEKGDTIEQAKWLSEKLLKLRIFEDEDNKMNLSIQDIKGEILVVSQFTLAGNCKKGTRPSFDNADPAKTSFTSPESRLAVNTPSSFTTIPHDSCPLCWSA